MAQAHSLHPQNQLPVGHQFLYKHTASVPRIILRFGGWFWLMGMRVTYQTQAEPQISNLIKWVSFSRHYSNPRSRGGYTIITMMYPIKVKPLSFIVDLAQEHPS